jgi:hypothetical protein
MKFTVSLFDVFEITHLGDKVILHKFDDTSTSFKESDPLSKFIKDNDDGITEKWQLLPKVNIQRLTKEQLDRIEKLGKDIDWAFAMDVSKAKDIFNSFFAKKLKKPPYNIKMKRTLNCENKQEYFIEFDESILNLKDDWYTLDEINVIKSELDKLSKDLTKILKSI